MKVGLADDAPVVTSHDMGALWERMLPHARRIARSMYLRDPEDAAHTAVAQVVVEKRYQERWRPGTASVDVFLYGMIRNRLRDISRAEQGPTRRAVLVPLVETTGPDGDTWEQDERLATDDPNLATVELAADVAAVRGRLIESDAYDLLEVFDLLVSGALAVETSSAPGSASVARALGISRSRAANRLARLRHALATSWS